MAIKGILFDLYGTLLDIETDESLEEIYRAVAHYLTYQGVYLRRREVRDRYYEIMKRQKEASAEEYPEIDVEAIWSSLLEEEGIREPAVRGSLSTVLAHIHRAVSRKRLRLYPGVTGVLNRLRTTCRMALVSDAQPCYALPEMKAMKLDGYFNPVILSGSYGFRKPDERLMQMALDRLRLGPDDVLYVGNDMYRDIYGAKQLGIRSIFVDYNQGAKSYENVIPDYVVSRFEDVLEVIEGLK